MYTQISPVITTKAALVQIRIIDTYLKTTVFMTTSSIRLTTTGNQLHNHKKKTPLKKSSLLERNPLPRIQEYLIH